MKVGLISDIHGNAAALRAVLLKLREETDRVLFLGDLTGYYPFVNECVNLLSEFKNLTGIRGNHDQVLLECIQREEGPYPEYEKRYGSALRRSLQVLSAASKAFLQDLRPHHTLSLGDTAVSLFHGTPWDPLEGRVYPDFNDWDRFSQVNGDVIFLGHTHYPLVKRYRGKLIVNPGSVGQPRDRRGGACFAVLDLSTGAVQPYREAYDPQVIIEDARRHDPGYRYLVDVLNRQ